MLVFDGLLPRNDFSEAMRAELLLFDGLIGHCHELRHGNVNLWLHQMLRELVPHGLMPLSLHGNLAPGEALATVVIHRPSTELLVDFLEPEEDLVSVHVFQALLLDVAVDVGAGEVRMIVTLE